MSKYALQLLEELKENGKLEWYQINDIIEKIKPKTEEELVEMIQEWYNKAYKDINQECGEIMYAKESKALFEWDWKNAEKKNICTIHEYQGIKILNIEVVSLPIFILREIIKFYEREFENE